MSIMSDLQAVADELTAAGVRATLDPSSVAPPCALLTLSELEPDNAEGSAAGTVTVTLIAPGPDRLDARSWLWDTAAPAAGAVLGAVPLTFDPYGVDALPALTGTVTVGVTPWP